jgi:hypothetical protein
MERLMAETGRFVRTPRRIPAPEKEDQERDDEPRVKDFLKLLLCCIVLIIVLFAVSFYLHTIGLHQMALGLGMFGSILTAVSIGTIFMVGISYLVMRSFLKREFDKKFKKMDRERRAHMRRLMGLPEQTEDSE